MLSILKCFTWGALVKIPTISVCKKMLTVFSSFSPITVYEEKDTDLIITTFLKVFFKFSNIFQCQ